jgi:septal ring factor EnvC (AmiA/AmiB activator)
MNELRNLYLVKEKVIQIKFELAKNTVEINNLILIQDYEKAAEERDRKKTLMDSLNNQKQEVINYQKNIVHSVQHLNEQALIIEILYELNAIEQSKMEYREYLKEFIEAMKKEFDYLMGFKKAMYQDNKFNAAKLIQEEILLIGEFLLKYGK